MTATSLAPLSGRKAQAARNDETILSAAREVFLADPARPGISGRPTGGRGHERPVPPLSQQGGPDPRLCTIGLQTYIDLAEDCLDNDGDPWEAFATFMRRAVDAHTHAPPCAWPAPSPPTTRSTRCPSTPAPSTSGCSSASSGRVIRPDVDVADLGLIFEQISTSRTAPHRSAPPCCASGAWP